MKTVYGLFQNFETAQQVVKALGQANFSQEDIYLISQNRNGDFSRYPEVVNKGEQMSVVSIDSGIVGGLPGALQNLGIPREQSEMYADSLYRGFDLVLVHTQDDRADEAAAIMNRFKPVETNQPNGALRPEAETKPEEDKNRPQPHNYEQ